MSKWSWIPSELSTEERRAFGMRLNDTSLVAPYGKFKIDKWSYVEAMYEAFPTSEERDWAFRNLRKPELKIAIQAFELNSSAILANSVVDKEIINYVFTTYKLNDVELQRFFQKVDDSLLDIGLLERLYHRASYFESITTSDLTYLLPITVLKRFRQVEKIADGIPDEYVKKMYFN